MEMNIIATIAQQIGVPFPEMSKAQLEMRSSLPLRGYSRNDQGQVIAVRIENTCFADMELLTGLQHLETLILCNNDIDDFFLIPRFRDLKHLTLTARYCTDFSFISELTSLTALDLRENNLTDISFLGALPGLTSLNLSGNELANISVLGKLSGLNFLNLSFNKLTRAKCPQPNIPNEMSRFFCRMKNHHKFQTIQKRATHEKTYRKVFRSGQEFTQRI